MAGNQIYAWFNGYIDAFYSAIMNMDSADCIDETIFTDEVLTNKGPPQNNKYIVSKNGIVDHFELTLDLDYTQFVQMPTQEPTENPTQSPTADPTQIPSPQPTDTPSRSPSDTPTKSPSQQPTGKPTYHPSINPTTDPTVEPSCVGEALDGS